MFFKKWKDQEWRAGAITACAVLSIAACAAVVLNILLTHFSQIIGAAGTFLGYFKTIILGCIFAYLMNPLAKLYARTFLRKIGSKKLRWNLASILSVLTVIVCIFLLIILVLPQLIQSFTSFAGNFDKYAASLLQLVDSVGVSIPALDSLMDNVEDLSSTVLANISTFISENSSNILTALVVTGKTLGTIAIAMILSIYMLMARDSLLQGFSRLFRALLRSKYDKAAEFLMKCDDIFVHFIIYSLLDSLVIGGINLIFMKILQMQYCGLISVIVGVFNLIPTFGPVIGGLIGAFIILLVNPVHALIFIVFTFVLQFFDGYILKPKLFGGSLGISGLLILAAVIVFGSMFGVVGMLLAIPGAAILDLIYRSYLLPALERRAYGDRDIRVTVNANADGGGDAAADAAAQPDPDAVTAE